MKPLHGPLFRRPWAMSLPLIFPSKCIFLYVLAELGYISFFFFFFFFFFTKNKHKNRNMVKERGLLVEYSLCLYLSGLRSMQIV